MRAWAISSEIDRGELCGLVFRLFNQVSLLSPWRSPWRSHPWLWRRRMSARPWTRRSITTRSTRPGMRAIGSGGISTGMSPRVAAMRTGSVCPRASAPSMMPTRLKRGARSACSPTVSATAMISAPIRRDARPGTGRPRSRFSPTIPKADRPPTWCRPTIAVWAPFSMVMKARMMTRATLAGTSSAGSAACSASPAVARARPR